MVNADKEIIASRSNGHKLSAVPIIGIILGLFAAAIVLIIAFIMYKKRNIKESNDDAHEEFDTSFTETEYDDTSTDTCDLSSFGITQYNTTYNTEMLNDIFEEMIIFPE